MQVTKTLVLFAYVLIWGSSNVWARNSSPPDVVYPTTQDQESLDQLLKQSANEPNATAAPAIPAPTMSAPVPETAPAPSVVPTVEPAEVTPAPLPTGQAGVPDKAVKKTPPVLSQPETPGLGESVTPTGTARLKPLLPEHYSVWIWQENGDCLWRIAEKIYGDRDKWRLIYLANRDVIQDPNKIYPKQKLRIPPADWQPTP